MNHVINLKLNEVILSKEKLNHISKLIIINEIEKCVKVRSGKILTVCNKFSRLLVYFQFSVLKQVLFF